MLLQHQEQAINALPKLLPADREQRVALLEIVRRVVTARGALPKDSLRRLNQVETLFDVGKEPTSTCRSAARPDRVEVGGKDAA